MRKIAQSYIPKIVTRVLSMADNFSNVESNFTHFSNPHPSRNLSMNKSVWLSVWIGFKNIIILNTEYRTYHIVIEICSNLKAIPVEFYKAICNYWNLKHSLQQISLCKYYRNITCMECLNKWVRNPCDSILDL